MFIKNLFQKSIFQFKSEYLILFFVCFFISLSPSNTTFVVIGLFDDQRLYQLIIICLSLIWVLTKPIYNKNLIQVFLSFPIKSRVLLLILWVFGIFSSVVAPLANYALLELSLYIGLFGLSLVIASLFIQKPRVAQILFLTVFIISCVLYQTAFFAGYIASFIENLPLQWPEPFCGFSNIRFFNQYQLWLFFFISAPLLIYPTLKLRFRNGIKIIAIGWAILLFSSGSRGVVIAIFLSFIMGWIFFKQYAVPFIKLNSEILLSGFIGALILFKVLPLLLASDVISGWRTVEQLTTDAPRLYLWSTSVTYIKSSPWLGIGPMHYAYYPNSVAMHPHNSVLQWATELGLPSVFILVFLIMWGLCAWIKRFYDNVKKAPTDYANHSLWIVLFSTMIAELIYSLVDGVIVMPMSQTLMSIIAGWMFGLYFRAEHKIVDGHASFITLILAGATLVTLISTVMPSFIQKFDKLSQDSPIIVVPRFWQQGKIPN